MTTKTFLRLPEEKQQRIRDAALHEFASHGYHGGNLDRVAEAAEIAKGALYRYFDSKEELFAHLVDTLVDLLRGCVSRAFANAQMAPTVAHALRAYLDERLAFFAEHPTWHRFLQVVTIPAFRERLVFGLSQQIADGWVTLLQDRMAQGQVAPKVNAECAGFVIETVIERYLRATSDILEDPGLGLYQGRPDVLRRRTNNIIAVLASGLGVRTPSPPPPDHAERPILEYDANRPPSLSS